MSLPPLLPLTPEQTAAELLFRPLALLDQGRTAVGRRFTLSLGSRGPLVVTGAVEDVAGLLTATAAEASGALAAPALLPFLGEAAVLGLIGDDHRHARRVLGAVMAAPLPDLAALVHRCLDDWSVGDEVPLAERLGDLALSATVHWLLGRPCPALADAARLVLAHTSPALQLREAPWPPLVEARNRLRRVLADEQPDRDSVLGALASRGESRSWVLDQAVALVIAGHETTAATLAWAGVTLGAAPHSDPAHVAWEVLRLHPVIPFVVRTPRQDWPLGPWRVPGGTPVAVCSWLVHRDPGVWPDPQLFDPDRHRTGRPGPPRWFPFGGGARQCLGMHVAQQVLANVLAALERWVRFAPWQGPPPDPRRRNLTLGPQGTVSRRIVWLGDRTRPPAPGLD